MGSYKTAIRKRAEKASRARQRRRRKVWLSALVVVAAGGGTLFALNQRDGDIYDLSAVGNGTPAVVQVHDVTCPICTELRAQIETIQDEYDEGQLVIRIADVRDDAAVQFAAQYTTARRATLLFFDGDGTLVGTTSGAQSVAALRRAFDSHASGASID